MRSSSSAWLSWEVRLPRAFKFPVWLRGTPEDQAAEAQRQAALRASFSRAKLTEEEQLIGRGHLLEETARGNIEAAADNAEVRQLAEAHLAEALAMQGRYHEAAEASPKRRQEYEAIGAALEMDDSEKCDCPDVATGLTPRFERARIFSPIHGQVVSLVECQTCGHVNARPINSRLLVSRTLNAQNRAAAQGKLRGAVSDATALTTSDR